MKDKFSAVWISHSSIRDYLKCPRAYYLRNVYKDPKTGHKITVMSPPLALGQVVHETIEPLSFIPMQERLDQPLLKQFDTNWQKVSGKKGGFKNPEDENRFKERGIAMIKRIIDHPGPILNKAVKIRADGGLPYYWLSEEENIILCGKIDWLEYLPESDGLHIIDFKTGKIDEDPDSLQLPIYRLLVANLQKRPALKASYWYLNRADEPKEVSLPDLSDAEKTVLKIGRSISLARKLNAFKCPQTNGCPACAPLESVLKGEGELVGVSEYNQDIYFLN
jgi:CRISPR/Cas system-associated exonuclease Cas4 (RecB family)